MLLELVCPGCQERIAVSRRHRGRAVACPECEVAVEVPGRIDSRGRVRAAVADRRAGDRLYLITALSCVIWVPVVPAICLWIASGRIHHTREEGRPVPPPLRLARLLAATALTAQLAWIVMAVFDASAVPLDL